MYKDLNGKPLNRDRVAKVFSHTNSFNTRQSLQRANFEAEILQITYTFFVFTKSWPTSAL